MNVPRCSLVRFSNQVAGMFLCIPNQFTQTTRLFPLTSTSSWCNIRTSGTALDRTIQQTLERQLNSASRHRRSGHRSPSAAGATTANSRIQYTLFVTHRVTTRENGEKRRGSSQSCVPEARQSVESAMPPARANLIGQRQSISVEM